MRDDFCAFILTHGRPDKVLTYRALIFTLVFVAIQDLPYPHG